jgi:hypothetical protein
MMGVDTTSGADLERLHALPFDGRFGEMKTVRTYFAGLGSGGALLAAVIAGFLTLVALVAFDGLPSSSGDSDDGAVLVESNAPEIAAAAAATADGAPAATPATPATAGGGAAGAAGGDGDGAGTAPGGGGGSGPGGDGTNPSAPPPPGSGSGPAPGPAPGGGGGGDVAGVVGEVDDTVTGTTGIDLGLGDKTKPITDAVDGVIDGLNGELDVPDLPRIVDGSA